MFRASLTAFALLAAPALAQTTGFGAMQADTKAPVQMTADSLQVDQTGGSAVFSGNVVIGQGDMRLGASRVSVTYAQGDRSRIQSLHASGGVTLVSGPDAAEAAEAVYDVDAGTVVLTGNVILSQGPNVLTGNRMVIDLGAGTAQVDGRVQSVLEPTRP
ncbi:MAG: lipopolysaccharide transport periplasmic protein LptA [Paracoccus sp. (in: a-proteobacteria)]|uniref:lipopolysaccharide transport periplasmic protein LptA n=1 Tax=Paracoccus sp. TaxID=267 RepID=UPI0026DEED62|nr:lipopolysaccharide transport periplasmic protein LptA [Paracoccus sp. (in: a-proteobacteria)]MDO5621760.1 lipopolysaccharide transport periplasmic protein LptA [Paracoccus sp. (in: a-proteobacteria)]